MAVWWLILAGLRLINIPSDESRVEVKIDSGQVRVGVDAPPEVDVKLASDVTSAQPIVLEVDESVDDQTIKSEIDC